MSICQFQFLEVTVEFEGYMLMCLRYLVGISTHMVSIIISRSIHERCQHHSSWKTDSLPGLRDIYFIEHGQMWSIWGFLFLERIMMYCRGYSISVDKVLYFHSGGIVFYTIEIKWSTKRIYKWLSFPHWIYISFKKKLLRVVSLEWNGTSISACGLTIPSVVCLWLQATMRCNMMVCAMAG